MCVLLTKASFVEKRHFRMDETGFFKNVPTLFSFLKGKVQTEFK
jgi:hypothetical protein